MGYSSIPVPDPTPRDLATDEIDDRHFQGVKIHGGGEGVANELTVTEANEALATHRSYNGFQGVAIPSAAYDDGRVIGGAVPIVTGLPGGLYRVASLSLYMADLSGPGAPPASPLPPFYVALVTLDTSIDVAAVVGDNYDVAAMPVSIVPSTIIVPEAEIPASPLFPDWYRSGTPEIQPIAAGGPSSKMWAFVVADGAIATDLTPYTIGILAALERIAAAD